MWSIGNNHNKRHCVRSEMLKKKLDPTKIDPKMTICWNINILRSERERERERERNGSSPSLSPLPISPSLNPRRRRRRTTTTTSLHHSSFLPGLMNNLTWTKWPETWACGFPRNSGIPPQKKYRIFIFPIMVYVWVVVCFDHKPYSNTLLSSRDAKKHKNQIFPVPNSRGTANRD